MPAAALLLACVAADGAAARCSASAAAASETIRALQNAPAHRPGTPPSAAQSVAAEALASAAQEGPAAACSVAAAGWATVGAASAARLSSLGPWRPRGFLQHSTAAVQPVLRPSVSGRLSPRQLLGTARLLAHSHPHAAADLARTASRGLRDLALRADAALVAAAALRKAGARAEALRATRAGIRAASASGTPAGESVASTLRSMAADLLAELGEEEGRSAERAEALELLSAAAAPLRSEDAASATSSAGLRSAVQAASGIVALQMSSTLRAGGPDAGTCVSTAEASDACSLVRRGLRRLSTAAVSESWAQGAVRRCLFVQAVREVAGEARPDCPDAVQRLRALSSIGSGGWAGVPSDVRQWAESLAADVSDRTPATLLQLLHCAAAVPGEEELRRSFVARNLPGLFSRAAERPRWHDRWSLVRPGAAGDTTAPVADFAYAALHGAPSTPMRLRDFVRTLPPPSNRSTSRRVAPAPYWWGSFAQDHLLAGGLAESVWSPWLRSAAAGRSADFFSGGAWSGAQLHAHEAAINVLSAGVKLWFLYPPTASRHGAANTTHGVAAAVWADLLRHDTGGSAPIVLVQLAGEIVFVPAGWGHAIVNLADSAGFSAQLATKADTMAVFAEAFPD
eukprot:TRINITY_DN36361_c0_g1_i1.p1 TRINITY_DN36361_c0_g1~~TRINITY_DN36361_c0_g1_i1.p1  ORF type:complete len:642 (+),score=133.99 TRINITY_DN36361_c0_g1_i1:47-1927(+)